MRKPLLALAVAAFGIGTTEFVIEGLLPNLATSFGVSIPRAGLLVSGYALSVTLGAPFVTLLVGRWNRKTALLALLGVFILGNAACAAAPSYALLMAARVLTALCHGAFFGIASIVAASVVPREKQSQAITIMFSGLTLANVMGVPAGTALGQAFGWRAAFAAIVPIGLVAAAGVWAMVPRQKPEVVRLRHELKTVLRPGVQLTMAMSTISSVALFVVFTYIAPILERVSRVSEHAVTRVLVVFGVGITIGTLLGGRLADWRPMLTILGGFALLVVLYALMPAAMGHGAAMVALVFVWGMVSFGTGAPMQSRVVDQAKGAPNLASTLNQGAFNLGNAMGASLGGLVLTAGWGYRRLPVVAGVVAAAGLVVAVTARFVEQREAGQAVEVLGSTAG